MNVAYVAPFGLREKTTVWARTLPLAAEVVASGHAATIVVPPWDSPQDSNTRAEEQGVPIIQVDLRGGLPMIWRRMLREVTVLKPRIVHIVKPRAYAGLVQWRLWQRRKTGGRGPAILLDIDDWEQAWAPINRYPAYTSRFLAWQEEWGIRHADGITAASRWLVERTERYAPDTPILYLPNGVTEPEYEAAPAGQPKRDDGSRRILFFSRFVEVEPAWLTAFWQALRPRLPHGRLLVAGNALQSGREERYVASMALAGADIADSVSWLGHIDREAIAQLYAESDCAIFPAVEEPLQQAKCSVRLATTLLHGVPVVASAVGEQATYGAEGAAQLVSAAATPEEFADQVYVVLQNREERRALADRARLRLLTQYNWARLGRDLVDFYENVAARHG